MNILHVTESHELAAGGVSTVVDGLMRFLVSRGHRVGLICTGKQPMTPPPGVTWRSVPPGGLGKPWGASSALPSALDALFDEFNPEVVHLHGAWRSAQWLAARAARKRNLPFVMSFHGMLEPYHWNERGILQLLTKRLYWRLLGRPMFSDAACVHAVTNLERQHLGMLLGDSGFTVIPNLVDLSRVDRALAKPGVNPTQTYRRLGFCGRLHPKKGVELLIQAFENLAPSPPWDLWLAGPDDDGRYGRTLRALVLQSNLRDRIRFVGPVYGETKWTFLRNLWVAVVPSFSEAIGLVNLEAAACGTPTITTSATGLEQWDRGGGLLIEAEVEALTDALRDVVSWTDAERKARGANARAFVEANYSWERVGPRWVSLYERVTDGNRARGRGLRNSNSDA